MHCAIVRFTPCDSCIARLLCTTCGATRALVCVPSRIAEQSTHADAGSAR
jgi:hypothetical protein